MHPKFILAISIIFEHRMKHFLTFILFLLLIFSGFRSDAQQGDTVVKKRDSVSGISSKPRDTNPIVRRDTAKKMKTIPAGDSVEKVQIPTPASTYTPKDSIQNDSLPALPFALKQKSFVTGKILKNNKLINASGTPQYFIIHEREPEGKEILFYGIAGLLLLIGLFKAFNQQYFSNLFRVYFNTSLRQSQLSEQLLQARLPSFLMNIFFVIVAGIFAWQMFVHFNEFNRVKPYVLLQFCIGVIAVIYIVKYCFLKFIGWAAAITPVMDRYIFIIFMVNKIMAILLLPFIVLLAFGHKDWFSIVKVAALLSVGLLFLSRYAKSYGLLGQKIEIKPFHFILFFIGAELIPCALLYKATIDYFIG